MRLRALLQDFAKLALVALLSVSPAPRADEPSMLRAVSTEPYPETMMRLQSAIEANGYRFSRVQRVDYGLRRRGYDVPPYRIVFFGNPADVRFLSVVQPQLLPFLPLKIIVYEDGEKVVLLAADPTRLAQFFPASNTVALFNVWRRDIEKILRQASQSE